MVTIIYDHKSSETQLNKILIIVLYEMGSVLMQHNAIQLIYSFTFIILEKVIRKPNLVMSTTSPLTLCTTASIATLRFGKLSRGHQYATLVGKSIPRSTRKITKDNTGDKTEFGMHTITDRDEGWKLTGYGHPARLRRLAASHRHRGQH